MQDSRREHVVPYGERVVTKAFGHVELAFDDLLDQFHAGDDPPGIEETLELNPNIGPNRALMRRGSCSTTLLKYGQVRI
jgi:hypothetical protein